jgi:hypothetical protein
VSIVSKYPHIILLICCHIDHSSIALAIVPRRSGSSSVAAAAASSRHSNDDDSGGSDDDEVTPLHLISRAIAAVRSLFGSRSVARVHPNTQGDARPCIRDCGCNRPPPGHTEWASARLTASTDVSTFPNIQIHPCDRFYDLKKYAARMMRREEGSNTTHGRSLVESLISVMAQVKSTTPFITALILKCVTPRLNHSIANYGMLDLGANVLECPSHYSSLVLNRVFPSNGIEYPNGLSFLGLNSRSACRTKPHANPRLNGIHCEDWTQEEAEYTVRVLRWFIYVLNYMQIPLLFLGLGGDAACSRIINELKNMVIMMCQGATEEVQSLYRRNVRIIEGGTHFSNFVCWRWQYEKAIDQVCLMHLLTESLYSLCHSFLHFLYPRLYVSARM